MGRNGLQTSRNKRLTDQNQLLLIRNKAMSGNLQIKIQKTESVSK